MRELLRSWLTKAANDLRTARILGAAEDGPLDTASAIASKPRKKPSKPFWFPTPVTPEKTRDVRKRAVQA